MSTLLTENFEAGLGAYTLTGTPVTTTAVQVDGISSLSIPTGNTRITYAPAVHRQHTARFYFRWNTDAPGAASVYQVNASTFVTLQVRPGMKLRVSCAGTNSADSAALALGQWYRIDLLFDTSASPWSAAYQIDGVAQTGATNVRAASDITSVYMGNTGGNNFAWFADAWVIRNTSAEYPIGAPGGSARKWLRGIQDEEELFAFGGLR